MSRPCSVIQTNSQRRGGASIIHSNALHWNERNKVVVPPLLRGAGGIASVKHLEKL
jgi:hypothetical protein